MTGYEDGLDTEIIFAPKKIEESLATAISNAGKKQLHISETEKYMHVTYFFNGGYEDPHPGEDFVNIASPKVFDYSETPEMSADKTAKELIARMESTDYSFIVINIVNPDMLGHTGELEATVKANEYVDKKTEEIVRATLQKNGAAIIIADHGNCEVMIDHDTGKPHTYHTNNPIPFILVEDRSQVLREQGESVNKVGTGRDVPTSGLLADVAPTILSILDIDPPNEMSGLDLTKVL
jgi:2,3-bisphosphoglycerate-independent phosphoglycerate mutase